jgi:hypothetical protein
LFVFVSLSSKHRRIPFTARDNRLISNIALVEFVVVCCHFSHYTIPEPLSIEIIKPLERRQKVLLQKYNNKMK